jgi:hypothetical protein
MSYWLMPRPRTYVMNIRLRRWPQALLLAFGIVALSGYTISPSKKVHEWMTTAAYLCYQQAVESARKPLDCRWPHRNDVLPENIAWFGGATKSEDWRSYPTLEAAVRWPDDTTGQIAARKSLPKFLISMGWTCGRLAKKAKRKANNINDGLLCNSHYGTMQFLHAQASDTGEAPVHTNEAIERWPAFLYAIASRALPDDSLDASFYRVFAGGSRGERPVCRHFRTLGPATGAAHVSGHGV